MAALGQGLRAMSASSALFALVFQGINGLIQVAAFFSLAGEAYLHFSNAFITGTVVSMLCVLNFENMALGGRATRSVQRYAVAFWVMGVASTLPQLTESKAIPSFVTFCCFGVCLRIFLAWATHARPWAPGLLLAGAAMALACLRGQLAQVMLVAFMAFPLALLRSQRPAVGEDAGLVAVLRTSAVAFSKYLPHTLSGLLVGYVDRYAALHLVGGVAAEIYLRTVQICSWAAFVAYPVIFHARKLVLQAGRLQAGTTLRLLATIAAALGLAVMAILAATLWSGRLPAFSAPVVLLVFTAIVCSQSYQVVSALNFVGERFGIINRITVTSAATVVSMAVLLVPLWPSPVTLSVVLLSGWTVQLAATIFMLQRHRS